MWSRLVPRRSVLLALAPQVPLAVAALLMVLGSGASRAAGQSSFPEVLERLNQVNPGLVTFIVDQAAQVRVLGLFRWELRATVYAARPARYKVVVHNMPAVLRGLGSVFAGVSSAEQLLADYRATAVRRDGGAHLVVEVAGARPEVNPPAGVAVIDEGRWTVEELRLRYSWGELLARYRYTVIDGYLLPTSARVWVFGIPAQADLTYSNYRLNVPLPPDTFPGD
ncbi:MAG: hypothetical protein QN152_11840 [Armatimonadota bacterium]|nr:hypothetical protein [Armatimonadota bacterium]MDR7427536.1 hypothetical protein [Armatimonadota bacterium]MDR7463454.1 hypothetical protein [Armatimonadota bacterium]MDR7469700.1 hypothetical protein [Armatimonadota bacterium]MDR7473967.1 hypothetical protein [Armatimonadota bacterium]